MNPVITPRAMRDFEAAHFAAGSASPEALMLAAGNGAAQLFFDFFRELAPAERQSVVILAGHGTNGGDGIVMANALVRKLDVPVRLVLTAPPERLAPTAAHFFKLLAPEVIRDDDAAAPRPGEVVIDALLGTGLSGTVREPYRSRIAAVNASGRPVFSVDLPSGLGADLAVRADMTAVIGFYKDTLFTAQGECCTGRLRRVPLPLPGAPEAHESAFDSHDAAALTPRVEQNIHKYRKGSVLIFGGSRDYPFAPFLSARAALRGGAGLVKLFLPEGTESPGALPLSLIVNRVAGAEQYWQGLAEALRDGTAFASRPHCLVAGPGLGRKTQSAALIEALCRLDQPLVLDADGLFFAAQMADLVAARRMPTLLTPHWGEAETLARGAGLSLDRDDPAGSARSLAQCYRACVVLKGRFSVTAAPDGTTIRNTSGTPALAVAGSGDCLTGLAGALLAAPGAGSTAERAALAVFLHGLAGEIAARHYSDRGVIADDLPDLIPAAWRMTTFRA